MVSVKGTASELEKEILGGIIEPNCPNIEFKTITFDCKSIKDAAGHIFINQTYCNAVPVRHEEDGTLWVTVEDCEKVGRVIIKNEQGHFCRVFYMGEDDE